MLTLPDIDSRLEEARLKAEKAELKLQVIHPTPWRTTKRTENSVVYQHSADGWMARVNGGDALALSAPVILNPSYIDKPWGQEIWYSGIESRGESSVSQNNVCLPLSDYLALAPNQLVQRAAPLLLKILDPAPHATSGNLYFETHNTKHEVYVVTDVNQNAWPDSVGAIRLGMNQKARKRFSTDEDFRNAYLEAVRAYERVRRAIDDNSAQGDPAKIQQQANEEKTRRNAMEEFTELVPLRRGDVVQVSPHIPHSLQHGVRVFEFQTPTYERNIISFNQRVLTQDHWDSDYAIENMSLDGATAPNLETLIDDSDKLVERIVDFEDFEVQRVTLKTKSAYAVDPAAGYLTVAAVDGAVSLVSDAGTGRLTANTDARAGLLPACAHNARLIADTADSMFLLARPKACATDTIPMV